MPSKHTPSPQQAEFDALCAHIEDWDPLPTTRRPAPEEDDAPDEEHQSAAMDRLIFASLVSPL